jgi:hypothetical protein
MMLIKTVAVLSLLASLAVAVEDVSPGAGVKLVPISTGTAKNTVNVVIFRKSSVVSHGDTQFAAFYDGDGHVVLAKRKLSDDKWETKTTALTGTLNDAHNAINIGVDGEGVLHIAWDHHNNPLNYRKGSAPYSLDLIEAPMTGEEGKSVTYPEFHSMPNGDLLFFYRDGASGKGNLAMNRYDLKTHTWKHLFSKLVDGENKRNAYWQVCTDAKGTIHLSWVWRESPDVASNHDMSYARSTDGGATWEKSTGERYDLPITLANAERAATIPQKHELINQTSMTADADGHPYIATYFRSGDSKVPQYQLIYNDGKTWSTLQVSDLKTAFTLGGGGSKRLPLSRPQILSRLVDGKTQAYLLFRAEENGNKITLASCPDLATHQWTYRDITTNSVGQYEPSYDVNLWQAQGKLDVFVEHAEQVDGEGVGNLPPQMVYIAEVDLSKAAGK